MKAVSDDPAVEFSRIRKVALIVGVAGIALSVVGFFVSRERFFGSYLFASVFWIGLVLGCFPLLMIYHLTGGRWGFVIRRFLEAGLLTLPLLFVLFLPVLFGLGVLYPWMEEEGRSAYLNPAGFVVRLVFYFVVWVVLAWLLNRWSAEQDRSEEPEPKRRLRALSAPGLIIYGLTVSFASIDWVMSLESNWYSTVFPLVVAMGQMLLALAFAIVLLAGFRRAPVLEAVLTGKHFHHLGNLLLTLVMMWAYVAFSQLIVGYAGNLPQHTNWYLHRIAGGWLWVIVGVAVFHFGVPFVLLLSRDLKENWRFLGIVAGLLIAANAVNLFWQVIPSLNPEGFSLHWLDPAVFVGIGGLWLALYFRLLGGRRLLPKHEPGFEGGLGEG